MNHVPNDIPRFVYKVRGRTYQTSKGSFTDVPGYIYKYINVSGTYVSRVGK